MVARLQSKKRTDRACGGFDGKAREQLTKQLPKKRGIEGVARKRVAEKDRERASAPRALAAIGAEDTLTTRDSAMGLGGIVALEKAMAVQRTGPLAEWAALLFKRKNNSLR